MVLVLAGLGFLLWYKLQPVPIEVTVKRVERATVKRIVANTRAGTLKACRQANLSPAIGGRIVKLPVKKGDIVRPGQLLVELWNKDLAAQLILTETELAAATSRAEAGRLQAEVAGREADRLLILRKSGAVAEKETDRAVSTAAALKAEYTAALTAIETNRARLGVIRAEMERTRLEAPFAGVVAEINGELNEYVTPSPPGIPTPPTIELLDISCFYVTAPIDEVDAPAIRVGMEAFVLLDAFSERRFTGQVRRVAPYVLDVEKQARTVDVEVAFNDPVEANTLLAGYSADVEIILGARNDILRIPTRALLDKNRVFIFQAASSRLEERKITVGISNWEQTEVTGGLAEGDLIVLSIDRPGLKDKVRAVAKEEP